MRNLHIVKGIHSFPGIELERKELEAIDKANHCLLDAALHGKRTGYFFDGKVFAGAKMTNEIIAHYEKYVQLHLSSNPHNFTYPLTTSSIDQFLETFWPQPLGQELKKTMALFEPDYSLDSQLPRLVVACVLGYDIKFLPTETDPNPLTLLKGKVTDRVMSQITEAEKTLPLEDFIYHLYSHPQIHDLLISQRDTDIFTNVKTYGVENNVLFMGLNHPLRDFETQPHDFKITQTIIDE